MGDCTHHFMLNSENVGPCKLCGAPGKFEKIVETEDMPDYWPKPKDTMRKKLPAGNNSGIHTITRQANPFYYGGGIESREHKTDALMTADSGWRVYA